MKHCCTTGKCLLLSLMLIALVLSAASCFRLADKNDVPTKQGTLSSVSDCFDPSMPPARIIQSGNTICILHQTMNQDPVRISVGTSFENRVYVYESEKANVWTFDFADGVIVWGEKPSADDAILRCWSEESGVVTLFSFHDTEEFHTVTSFARGGKVYYVDIDYKNQKAAILMYDPVAGTTENVFTLPYRADYSVQTMCCVGDTVYVATVDDTEREVILCCDLNTGEITPFTLPESIVFIFGMDYDETTSTFALYYADTMNNERIGTVNTAGELHWVFDFNPNYYAYKDKVTIEDGKIYWIGQANVTGNTIDHYELCVLDTATDSPCHYKYAYYVTKLDSNWVYLAFDPDGATLGHVQLYTLD